MLRLGWVLLSLTLVTSCFVALLIVASRSSPGAAQNTRERQRLKWVKEAVAKIPPGGQPTAFAAEMRHDFGTMNPQTTGEHVFVVRNTGFAPLTVNRGPTSCKCTLSKVRGGVLMPGDETDVALEWNTGISDARFAQSATILTNDPERPELVFEISGQVRLRLFTQPPQAVMFPTIIPGTASTAEILVGSQLWQEFTISKVECSVPGVSWKLEPLSEEALRVVDARAAYRIVLTSPANLEENSLSGVLRLTATGPDESSQPETLELSLGGRVGRRIAVYGPEIDETGLVDFGLLDLGQGAKASFILRVRDPEPQLKSHKIRVSPEFVTANLKPVTDSQGVAKPGLYSLHVEVPADAPAGNFQGVNQGRVALEFEHPRIDRLDIELSFAVKSGPLE